MFEDDFPLLNPPSLMALILHHACAGPVTLDSCTERLDALFAQAGKTPELSREEVRALLAGHLEDLAVARLVEADGAGWSLTARGREAVTRHPEGVDRSDLMAYPEFAEHLRSRLSRAAGMDPRGSAYDEGYEARRKGQPFTANPYTANTVDHLSWENGWMQGQQDSGG